METSSLGKVHSIKKSVLGAMCAAGMSLALLFGMAAMPSQAYANEMPTVYAPTSYSDSVSVVVKGQNIEKDNLTLSQLSDAGVVNPNVTGYLYKRNSRTNPTGKEWMVMATKNTVTIEDLLAQAKDPDTGMTAADYWKSGAQLKFYALEENPDYVEGVTPESQKYVSTVYNSRGFQFTYDTLQSQCNFYNNLQADGTFYQNNRTSTPSPASIVFNYKNAPVSGLASSSLTNLKTNDTPYTDDVRFMMGLDIETVGADGDSNMGVRLPYGIVGVEVIPVGVAA